MMKTYLKIVLFIFVTIAALRSTGMILLFMDTSSDFAVLIGFLATAFVALAEALVFWLLFCRKPKVQAKEETK